MNIKKMESKVKVWLARDKDGSLYAYSINRPVKFLDCWFSSFSGYLGKSKKFPSVKWEDDEPTEAYITLTEPQEQSKPKQEIDWEQRRYEIAKELMYKIYRQKVAVSMQGQGIMLKDIADIAIAFADTLIKELKEKSDEL